MLSFPILTKSKLGNIENEVLEKTRTSISILEHNTSYFHTQMNSFTKLTDQQIYLSSLAIRQALTKEEPLSIIILLVKRSHQIWYQNFNLLVQNKNTIPIILEAICWIIKGFIELRKYLLDNLGIDIESININQNMIDFHKLDSLIEEWIQFESLCNDSNKPSLLEIDQSFNDVSYLENLLFDFLNSFSRDNYLNILLPIISKSRKTFSVLLDLCLGDINLFIESIFKDQAEPLNILEDVLTYFIIDVSEEQRVLFPDFLFILEKYRISSCQFYLIKKETETIWELIFRYLENGSIKEKEKCYKLISLLLLLGRKYDIITKHLMEIFESSIFFEMEEVQVTTLKYFWELIYLKQDLGKVHLKGSSLNEEIEIQDSISKTLYSPKLSIQRINTIGISRYILSENIKETTKYEMIILLGNKYCQCKDTTILEYILTFFKTCCQRYDDFHNILSKTLEHYLLKSLNDGSLDINTLKFDNKFINRSHTTSFMISLIPNEVRYISFKSFQSRIKSQYDIDISYDQFATLFKLNKVE